MKMRGKRDEGSNANADADAEMEVEQEVVEIIAGNLNPTPKYGGSDITVAAVHDAPAINPILTPVSNPTAVVARDPSAIAPKPKLPVQASLPKQPVRDGNGPTAGWVQKSGLSCPVAPALPPNWSSAVDGTVPVLSRTLPSDAIELHAFAPHEALPCTCRMAFLSDVHCLTPFTP
jgi:hypothetical protein